ncbi:hypothetical protein TNCV_720921 [Trichonephila clavipes]|nr:hypothetical protein TNCV_720921 [Trichonephila clavipes]
MTSSTNWSERTDVPEQPQPNSPSRIVAGDDHIAEFSDLFREAIQARNVYAAWARKLTNARPNDPKLQSCHQEVTKAGESVELLLVKLNVPLFRIPASEKELDKIVLRVKNRVSDPPAEKNDEVKNPAAVSPPPPASPRSKGRKAKRKPSCCATLPTSDEESSLSPLDPMRYAVSFRSKTLTCFWSRKPGLSRVSTPRSQTIVLLKTMNRISHTVTRGGTAIYCKNESVHHRFPLPNLQGMDATAVQN